MRSGFGSRQGIHDLIVITTLSFTPWATVKVGDTHEIMFSVAGIWSIVWLRYYFTLKHCGGGTVPKSWYHLIVLWPAVVMKADEVHSIVGSGPVPYTLLARLSIGL